jgi:serine/threonine protein kinase
MWCSVLVRLLHIWRIPLTVMFTAFILITAATYFGLPILDSSRGQQSPIIRMRSIDTGTARGSSPHVPVADGSRECSTEALTDEELANWLQTNQSPSVSPTWFGDMSDRMPEGRRFRGVPEYMNWDLRPYHSSPDRRVSDAVLATQSNETPLMHPLMEQIYRYTQVLFPEGASERATNLQSLLVEDDRAADPSTGQASPAPVKQKLPRCSEIGVQPAVVGWIYGEGHRNAVYLVRDTQRSVGGKSTLYAWKRFASMEEYAAEIDFFERAGNHPHIIRPICIQGPTDTLESGIHRVDVDRDWIRAAQLDRASIAASTLHIASAENISKLRREVGLDRRRGVLMEYIPGTAKSFDYFASVCGRYDPTISWDEDIGLAPTGNSSSRAQVSAQELRLCFEKLRLASAQILSAVEHIHSSGMIHCDIKPQNVLILSEEESKDEPNRTPRIRAVLIDYGHARARGMGERKHGTPATLAPEVSLPRNVIAAYHVDRPDTPADWWAFGSTVSQWAAALGSLFMERPKHLTGSHSERRRSRKTQIKPWGPLRVHHRDGFLFGGIPLKRCTTKFPSPKSLSRITNPVHLLPKSVRQLLFHTMSIRTELRRFSSPQSLAFLRSLPFFRGVQMNEALN